MVLNLNIMISFATIAIVAMSLPASSQEFDEIVPERRDSQMEASTTALGFLSTGEQTHCEINVERCFSSSQYPAPDACQEAVTKCDALETSHGSAKAIKLCRKDAESKCVWTKATKGFVASYRNLCGREIKVKAASDEQNSKREKRSKEARTKSEKTAKGATEALLKCQAKEKKNKSGFEREDKHLEMQVKGAEKHEVKLRNMTRFTATKLRDVADKQETELFSKEQTTKERGFKRVKETSDKAEAKTKSLREQLYKRQKISKSMQESIYKDWNKKAEFELQAKATEKAHKKPKKVAVKKKIEVAPKQSYVAEKEPVIPIKQPECLCSFPFVYDGVTHFNCLSKNKTLFCLDAHKKIQDCKPACQAVWKVDKKKSTESPGPPPKHVSSKSTSPVASPAPPPTPTPVPQPTHELRLKAEEKEVKHFKELLTKASEKHIKAKNDTVERRNKCALKVKSAQKNLEQKNKSELSSKKEISIKKEKTNKLESGQKENRLKENMTKEATSKQSTKHAAALDNLKKESASKMASFKVNESSAKKAGKEKKSKHPFNGLKAYCGQLQKLKVAFAKTKESDTKTIKEMQKKNIAQYKTMTKYNEQSVKALHKQQCLQTKEVCSKIHLTSEKREKHAAQVADERKSKLEAKCALSARYQAAEAVTMKYAICAAAHEEVVQILHSIEHQQGDIIRSAKSRELHELTDSTEVFTYSVVDSAETNEMKTELQEVPYEHGVGSS